MMWHLSLPFTAVLLGFFLAALLKSRTTAQTKLLLAFSGAFLLSAVVSEFLPEIFDDDLAHPGGFLLLGVLFQIVLEFFSKGAEHGHIHSTSNRGFPVLLFISLCLHAYLEGMPLQEGSGMIYGIAVHKLPIAFIFTGFLLNSGYGWIKSLGVMLIFALMSPLGSLTADFASFSNPVMLAIKAVVAGVVLHVSTTLILEASEAHKFNLVKVAVMIIGGLLGYFL
ncbi:MAG: ZIP family metal transporter [Nonlabens sp.]